jgi:hypothetical protein
MEEVTSAELFMCGVDYQHHLENDAYGTKLYPSIEDIRAQRKCVESCGIVAVRVQFVRWVREQNWSGAAALSKGA